MLKNQKTFSGFGFPSSRAPTTRGWSANLSGGFAVARILPLLNGFPAAGACDARRTRYWSKWPRPRLALIIVLDQFSRSLYRDTARAFAQDPKALALTLEGLEIGHFYGFRNSLGEDLLPSSRWGIPRSSRTWIAQSHLPSSSRKMQRRKFVRILEHSASQARGHRDVIARFGRHPHRNAVLGRQSTPEELDYLASEKLVHTRAPPQ